MNGETGGHGWRSFHQLPSQRQGGGRDRRTRFTSARRRSAAGANHDIKEKPAGRSDRVRDGTDGGRAENLSHVAVSITSVGPPMRSEISLGEDQLYFHCDRWGDGIKATVKVLRDVDNNPGGRVLVRVRIVKR